MQIANQSRKQFETLITTKSAGKQDIMWNLKDTNALAEHVDGHLQYRKLTPGVNEANHFSLTNWALTQLCEQGKVPLAFYNRCTNPLKASIYNEHVARLDKTMRFRRICDPNNKAEDPLYTIRAVMSDGYTLMDDDMLYPVVTEALAAENITNYSLLEYDDHITRLMIRFSDAQGTFQNMEHTAGMVVTNSETGHSAVWVEPAVFANGYTWMNHNALRQQDMKCRLIHRGEISPDKIREMIQQAKKISQVGVVQLAEAWNERVTGPQVVALMKSFDVMPVRLQSIFEEQMEHIVDIEKANVAQQILKLAQELPLFSRIQVEQSVGSFIGLFSNVQVRMISIMEELNE